MLKRCNFIRTLLIFVPNEQSIIKPISSSKAKREPCTKLIEATRYAWRFKDESANVEEKFIGEKHEAQALIKFAHHKNLWFSDYADVLQLDYIDQGVESLVYLSSDRLSVFKVNNGIQHGTWTDFFQRILAHNEYFPDTEYSLEGFTIRDEQLAVILSQPVIAIERSATPDELRHDLTLRGFDFHGINDVRDNQYGVVLRDLHRENAVINAVGNISYLDPIIQFYVPSVYIDELKSLILK